MSLTRKERRLRLIDADAIPTVSADQYEEAAFRDTIEDMPTIDAVPVVRCKYCKHRDAGNGFCEGRGWPMQLVPDDGFCDKGERTDG